jgi:uracil-DNA glycosylase
MSLSAAVEKIRRECGNPKDVPGFDPNNGNEKAKFLFLFEATGAKALKTGYISFDNPDPTARKFKQQLEQAGISRKEIALWNTVPWYIGNNSKSSIRAAKGKDIQSGISFLQQIVEAMPALQCIVLVGSAARRAHIFLSQITEARILSCNHTLAKVMNTNPNAWAENVSVLRFMKQTSRKYGYK